MNTFSGMFKLNVKDFMKGAVMAVLGGIALPLDAALQTPNFSVLTTDWHQIGILALNGGIIGFLIYIVKNFLSTSDGKVAGVIG